jgi:hypothetical protein
MFAKHNVFSENKPTAQVMCQRSSVACHSRAYFNSVKMPKLNQENGKRIQGFRNRHNTADSFDADHACGLCVINKTRRRFFRSVD